MRSLLFSLSALLGLASAASAETYTVTQIAQSFSPVVMTINIGDTILWQWTSFGHDVTEGTDGTIDGDEAFHAPLDPNNQTFELTFDQAFLNAWPRPGNVYDYFCTPHFGVGMTGQIIVSDGPGVIYCSCDGEGGAPTCGNYGYFGEGCRNSGFIGGKLRSHGSASVGADDLSFEAQDLLPNQPALLFAGTIQVSGGDGIPFGDGLRCAGGTVKRLGVALPDSSGLALWGPGLAPAGGWGAGDQRHFQTWYRDPVNGPCNTGFNLTNGLTVDFAG